MENEREKLKALIEELTELYEDEETSISKVSHSTYSSTCTPCKSYGDTIFDNIVIVSGRSK